MCEVENFQIDQRLSATSKRDDSDESYITHDHI